MPLWASVLSSVKWPTIPSRHVGRRATGSADLDTASCSVLVPARQAQRRPSTAFTPLTLSRSQQAIGRLPIAPLQARSVYTRALLPHRHLHLRALESGLDPPLRRLALAKVTYTQFAGGKVQQILVCLCLASSHNEHFPSISLSWFSSFPQVPASPTCSFLFPKPGAPGRLRRRRLRLLISGL